jgi:hypothetical protein
MNTRRLLTSTLLAVGLAGGFVHASNAPNPASAPGAGEPTLAEVRRATERFRDVKVALAEGYIRDPLDMCETAEMMGRPAALGAMGLHFFRPDLLGITRPPSPRVSGTGTHTDFRQPSILIYEPQADGSLELVAVENLVFADAYRHRRGAYVRAALRSARLDLSGEPERRVRTVESGGHVRESSTGQDPCAHAWLTLTASVTGRGAGRSPARSGYATRPKLAMRARVMVASASGRSIPRDATLQKLRDGSAPFRRNHPRLHEISETVRTIRSDSRRDPRSGPDDRRDRSPSRCEHEVPCSSSER